METGKNYYIETPTKYWIGRVVGIENGFIELAEASWIADTGRFQQFLQNGVADEVEPVTDGIWHVSLAAITGYCEWKHALPREQK